MGKMGKQDGRPGKSLGNARNMLKNFRVKKLGTVGLPETHNFFYFSPYVAKRTLQMCFFLSFV